MRYCKRHNRFYPERLDACPRCAGQAVNAAERTLASVTGVVSRCHACWNLLQVCACPHRGSLAAAMVIAGRRGGKASVQHLIKKVRTIDEAEARRLLARFDAQNPDLAAYLRRHVIGGDE